MRTPFETRPDEPSPALIETASAMLRRIFPHAPHLTPAYLSWQYRDNPDGRALTWNGWAGGAMVGHIAGLPLTARMDGVERRGIYFVNAAIDPAFRARGMIQRLANALMKRAAEHGAEFCLAVGNARSTGPLLAGYRDRPGFTPLGQLEARIGLGLPRRKAWSGTPSFERLWSEESLRWRLANPERNYAVRARRERMSVTAPSGRAGIGALLYRGRDFGGIPAGGRATGPLHVWIGLDPAADWKRSAFLPIPRRLRPSPLNLVYLDLTRERRLAAPDPARILFQAIDFDAF